MLYVPFLDEAIQKLLSKSCNDDTINRLCNVITPCLLIFFTLFICAKQYVGEPIQCWVPQEFESGWEEYAEDICFIKNTYYIPINESIPRHQLNRSQTEIGYYQWVPIILSLMSFMLYLPKWIKKLLINQSNIDIDGIIMEAVSLKNLSKEDRQSNMKKLKNYIDECLEYEVQNNYFFNQCSRFTSIRLIYITTIHICINFFNSLNIIFQFLFLNNFLGSKYTMWGYEVIKDLVHGKEWEDSPIFPRVTLCDFQVRRLANIHHYTIQCVLMINMINEKIFLFLWFWFSIIAIIASINFLYSFWKFFLPMNRERNLYIYFTDDFNRNNNPTYFKKVFSLFVNDYIKVDGYYILNYIEKRAGGILVKEIVHELFDNFLQNQKKI
ncbi:Innexin family-containing protein [Strongyloides ratti]|uniref:Innexin n=1 Tax=Strongyloides ratti TaxID=34506 RepID=A0A090L9P8_STRRB|nr:Innexin family-containing protein [Strongyloides ratti]CEF64863.1 Innexin family-containing protein [Strongyloides ratti]